MKRLPLFAALALAACSPTAVTTALTSPTGQLFCSIQTAGGGTIVAALVAGAVAGAGAPLAVIATNAGKAAVDADCAQAALAVPGATSGVPVSPPVNPAAAPQVAIVAPSSPVVALPH